MSSMPMLVGTSTLTAQEMVAKTTRDQFLLWEYTGIIPQYVELLLNVYLKYAEP